MTDETEKFNGWTNRETWLVNLWLSNDEGLYGIARELAAAAESYLGAGEAIKDYLEERRDDEYGTAGIWTDLINQALGRVNFTEIGLHMREK